jgi:PIN domain nuclease of toxin-antitoxin system
MALDWTHDPFDRLISAHALCRGIPLLTKDKMIRRRLKLAVW